MVSRDPDDRVLAQRHREGDRSAFEEIVARHKRVVYLTARRLLQSHEDADEAAQVAFVRAWRALDRFRGESSLRTWLVRIVLNVAKTMRSSARPTEALDLSERLADPRVGPEERIGLEQSRRRVREAVAGLPPRQREAVTLKLFSEMTCKEVAMAMGLSEGAVKAHLHQATANLRRSMASSEARSTER
jgi:RNA polymerase sigma-70 factor (ECF subfamily)